MISLWLDEKKPAYGPCPALMGSFFPLPSKFSRLPRIARSDSRSQVGPAQQALLSVGSESVNPSIQTFELSLKRDPLGRRVPAENGPNVTHNEILYGFIYTLQSKTLLTGGGGGGRT